jgi:Tol biopolymer transport system component
MARVSEFLLGAVLLACEASRPEQEAWRGFPSPLPDAPECVVPQYPIVFVSTLGASVVIPELYAMDPNGNTRPIGGASLSFNPVWSPDGRSLAFWHRARGTVIADASLPPNSNDLELRAADGTVPVVLTKPEQRPFDRESIISPDGPTWSPDGETLAYASTQGATGYRIWLIPRAGGPAHRLFPELEQPHFFPSWSLANGLLAYVSEEDGGVQDLWVVDVAHPERRDDENLTGGRVLAPKSPRWSPDGKWLAFSARDPAFEAANGRDFEIYRLEVESGHIEQLTHNRVTDLHPAWAPDGESLLVARESLGLADDPLDSQGFDLWRVPVADPEQAIALPGEGQAWRNCSPDWFWARCADPE